MNTILNSEYNLVTKLTTPGFKYKIVKIEDKTKENKTKFKEFSALPLENGEALEVFNNYFRVIKGLENECFNCIDID